MNILARRAWLSLSLPGFLMLGACATAPETPPPAAPPAPAAAAPAAAPSETIPPAAPAGQFEPTVGQEGKDVVWVPTPEALVEKMLDMAKVTPRDFVMDLGSGDGRNIIAAAKRGARGRGVEYNPEMVALSQRIAAKEGVADRAEFVRGDMFEADISQATVMALFLLPDNLSRLTPKFLALRPGTRMVLNGFAIPGWDPDATERIERDCNSWCTAYLYIVPARVEGAWQLPQGELTLKQDYQKISGTLQSGGRAIPVKGALSGDRITFNVEGTRYTGRVSGDSMRGEMGSTTAAWSAVRKRS